MTELQATRRYLAPLRDLADQVALRLERAQAEVETLAAPKAAALLLAGQRPPQPRN
jgi:cobalamin biosynthesis protein CobT